MRHVETWLQQVPQVGSDEEYDHVAIFRYVKCRALRREAFDPKTVADAEPRGKK
jgi:hypothetical protein